MGRVNLRVRRHVNAGLVAAGFAGALGGGWLIGVWCFGLVLIAESALCVYVGFARDDGKPFPVEGEHSVQDVLRLEARRQ